LFDLLGVEGVCQAGINAGVFKHEHTCLVIRKHVKWVQDLQILIALVLNHGEEEQDHGFVVKEILQTLERELVQVIVDNVDAGQGFLLSLVVLLHKLWLNQRAKRDGQVLDREFKLCGLRAKFAGHEFLEVVDKIAWVLLDQAVAGSSKLARVKFSETAD